MNNYYCLLLNDTPDYAKTYIAEDKITLIPAVLKQDTTSLKHISKSFMGLDDTIIETEDNYHIEGSFPVIAQEIEGEMYDIITGLKIKENPDGKTTLAISYSKKYPLQDETILSLLDEASKERYRKYLMSLKQKNIASFYEERGEKFYCGSLQTTSPDSPKCILVRTENGLLIDYVTKQRIYPHSHNSVTKHLTCRNITEITKGDATIALITILQTGIDKYLKMIRIGQRRALSHYHEYISKSIVPRERTRIPE